MFFRDASVATLFIACAAGCAGALQAWGVQIPFVLAALGFGAGIVLYLVLFRSELRADAAQAGETAAVSIDEGSAAT